MLTVDNHNARILSHNEGNEMTTTLTKLEGRKNRKTVAYAVLMGTSEIGTVEATGSQYAAFGYGGRELGTFANGTDAANAVKADYTK